MKYFVTVNGEEHVVELEEHGGRMQVRYDGEPVDARYEEVDRLGQVALFLGDRSFGISIEGTQTDALVNVAGHLYAVEIEDERERAAHQVERERGSSAGNVKSIMPGVVVQLLVAEGDVVSDGQPLLILEAMKMQNEIVSTTAGTVIGLHVTEGQAVGAGAKLATIKAAEEPGDQADS